MNFSHAFCHLNTYHILPSIVVTTTDLDLNGLSTFVILPDISWTPFHPTISFVAARCIAHSLHILWAPACIGVQMQETQTYDVSESS
jgi:hypothetical protein